MLCFVVVKDVGNKKLKKEEEEYYHNCNFS